MFGPELDEDIARLNQYIIMTLARYGGFSASGTAYAVNGRANFDCI